MTSFPMSPSSSRVSAKLGSRSAAVPSTTRRAPASSADLIDAMVRRPPASSTATVPRSESIIETLDKIYHAQRVLQELGRAR